MTHLLRQEAHFRRVHDRTVTLLERLQAKRLAASSALTQPHVAADPPGPTPSPLTMHQVGVVQIDAGRVVPAEQPLPASEHTYLVEESRNRSLGRYLNGQLATNWDKKTTKQTGFCEDPCVGPPFD